MGKGGLGRGCPESKLSFVKLCAVPSVAPSASESLTSVTQTKPPHGRNAVITPLDKCGNPGNLPKITQSLMELIIDTKPTLLITMPLREGESMGRERQQASY